ncbi:ABC transporter permease [bacterium]|nr:ABC transporter permease [bacterium]
MFYYMKLAWRNIFRNKRRTFIAGTAIGIGLAALIFTDALFVGMKENMIDSVTSSFLGEAQIHRENYRQTQEVEKTIQKPSEVISSLKDNEQVQHFAPRAISYAMITSPANVHSLIVYGIDPDREKSVSEIDENMAEGNYLQKETERGILIGKELAELLEVTVGDRLVVTVSQAQTGQLSQEMLRVSGIFHTYIKEMDKGMAFMKITRLQDMLGLPGGIHEVTVQFTNSDYALQKETSFTQHFSRFGNEAANWPQLMPQMIFVFQMTNFSLSIVAVIIFGVVIFGIINTLFMSLYERMFEFAVLRAVGTRPSGIRKLIIMEAGSLAVVSIIIGIILGFVLTFIMTQTGIDYRGLDFAGATMTQMLYPVMEIRQFIVHPILVFLFTILVSVYPALTAGKMKVADALRRSL